MASRLAVLPAPASAGLAVLLSVAVCCVAFGTGVTREAPLPEDSRSEAPALPQDDAEAKREPQPAAPPIFATPDGTVDGLVAPAAAAFDEIGHLVVLEPWASRVRVLRWETRATLRTFGERGTAAAQFHEPSDVAVSDGTAWITDRANHRVQGFGIDGAFRGTLGDAEGALLAPMGVGAFADYVAVADTGNHRVVVFRTDGERLGSFGRNRAGAGDAPFDPRTSTHLCAPHDVAIDTHGHFHVCDTGHHRIATFDRKGKFVRAFGGRGTAPGFFDQPRSITVHGSHLYVCDTRNHRVQVFDLEGNFVGHWGVHALTPHDREGRLHYPSSIAIDPRDEIADGVRNAVLCEPFEDRLQAFGSEVDPDRPTPRALPGNPATDLHFGQRISRRGSLAGIITEGETSVAIYDLRGKTPVRIHDLGRFGSGTDGLVAPTDVILTAKKRIVLCDPWSRRVEVYRHDWSPLDKIKQRPNLTRLVRSIDLASWQAGVPALAALPPLAFDQIEPGVDDTWVLLDSRQSRFVVVDARFTYQRHFGKLGDALGEFRTISDFTVAPNGGVIAVDGARGLVQWLRKDGELLFSAAGTEAGPFARPFGIASLDDGSVVVSDMALHRVFHLDLRGKEITNWGGATDRTLTPTDRLDPRYLFKPAGLATAPTGTAILVVDWGHHRAQLTDPAGENPVVFGARAFLRPPRRAKPDESTQPSDSTKPKSTAKPSGTAKPGRKSD